MQALLIYKLGNKNHLKALMNKISQISWGGYGNGGYDKGFYGSSFRSNLPDLFSNFMIAKGFLNEIILLSWQKNSSTGAKSGTYWGRNSQD